MSASRWYVSFDSFALLTILTAALLARLPAVCQSDTKTRPPGIYVALGDSITAGSGVTVSCKPFPHSAVDIQKFCPDGTSYPILVAKKLRADGIAGSFLNLGIPGATVAKVISDELPYIPEDATIITLYIGTNDSRQFGSMTEPVDTVTDRFELLYDQLLQDISKRAPHARMALINIPNEKIVGQTYKLTPERLENFGAISENIDRFINQHYPKYVVIDTICDPRSYIVEHRYKGSVHLNDAGAADLADAVLKVLLEPSPAPPPTACEWLH